MAFVRRPLYAGASVLLTLAALEPVAGGASVTVSSQVITGLTPFTPPAASSTDPQAVTACMGPAVFGGGAGGTTTTIYRNSESEPHIAVNPVNPNYFVVAYHQDRVSSGGGAVGLGIAYTFNGGKTWGHSQPGTTRCTGGQPGTGSDYERDTDPMLVFSHDGQQLFLSSIPFNYSQNFYETYGLTRSLDGGRTWLPAVTLSFDPTFGLRNIYDFERIAFDSLDGNMLYYLAQNYAAKGRGGKGYPFIGGSGRENQIVFSRSPDRGQTWETFRVIASFPVSNQDSSDLKVLPPSDAHPSGVLLVPILSAPGTVNTAPSKNDNQQLQILRSYDQGLTWVGPVTVFDVVNNTNLGGGGPVDLDNGIFFNGGLFDATVDPVSGNLYFSWLDARFDQPSGVVPVVSMSTDSGDTWSTPVRLSPLIPPGVQVSGPSAMAVAADGTLGITSYDFRADRPGDATWDVDVYLTLLRPTAGPNPTVQFVQEVRITTASMDARQFITRTTIGSGFGGYFPGDYFGLEAVGNDFVSVNTVVASSGTVPQSPPNTTTLQIDAVNHQDILFSRVSR
jgi:hypothetical protein